ncbi:MAG: YdeI/OmpD-associated family protein [Acidobacteriota bacterium]
MPKKDKRVDDYIAKAQPFAQPILRRIRAAFHEGCPDLVETLKWGNPVFEHQGILGGMVAFKKHAGLSFWRGTEVGDPKGIFERIGDTLLTQAKYTELRECPSKAVLVPYVKRAVKVNAALAKEPKKRATKKKTKARAVRVPADLAAALVENDAAREVFEGFSPTHRREYVEWLVEAKRKETRARRLAQAVEWMTEGKSRNWKYQPQRKTVKKAGKKKTGKKKTTKKKRARR